jgi:hypothetical protein
LDVLGLTFWDPFFGTLGLTSNIFRDFQAPMTSTQVTGGTSRTPQRLPTMKLGTLHAEQRVSVV